MVEAFWSRHPLFRRVEEEVLERALAAAQTLQTSRGETIYDRHRFRRCLGVVLEGRIRVQKDALVVSVLSQGDIFGAAALFNDREDYPTTLTALSDGKVLLIGQEAVRELLRESAYFAEDYAAYLAGRIQFLSARLDALSAGSAEEKLAQYLLTAADGEGRVTISATQLSARIGVGRATLYRAFEGLERSGAIAREGKTIRILSREELGAHPYGRKESCT